MHENMDKVVAHILYMTPFLITKNLTIHKIWFKTASIIKIQNFHSNNSLYVDDYEENYRKFRLGAKLYEILNTIWKPSKHEILHIVTPHDFVPSWLGWSPNLQNFRQPLPHRCFTFDVSECDTWGYFQWKYIFMIRKQANWIANSTGASLWAKFLNNLHESELCPILGEDGTNL